MFSHRQKSGFLTARLNLQANHSSISFTFNLMAYSQFLMIQESKQTLFTVQGMFFGGGGGGGGGQGWHITGCIESLLATDTVH